MSFGRDASPRRAKPRAMAPLETTITRRFAAIAPETSRASRLNASPVRLFEPILTMMRRARRRTARASAASLNVVAFVGDHLVEGRLEAADDPAGQTGRREEDRVDVLRH